MNGSLIIAICAGLGAMFGWGFADFFAKKTIGYIGDKPTLIWGHIIGSILFFLIIITNFGDKWVKQDSSITFVMFLILCFFGIFQAVVYTYVYRAFRDADLVIISPIFASYSAITTILSIIFLGEILNNQATFGISLLMTGILLLNLDFNALKAKKIQFSNIPGMREVLIATLMAAVWTLLWGFFLNDKNWLLLTGIMYGAMTLSLVIYNMFKGVNIFVVESKVWKYLVLIGVGEVAAYLSISIGFSHTNYISIVALLSSAFSIPAIIMAYLFLNEKMNTAQVTGVVVLIAGIMILAIV